MLSPRLLPSAALSGLCTLFVASGAAAQTATGAATCAGCEPGQPTVAGAPQSAAGTTAGTEADARKPERELEFAAFLHLGMGTPYGGAGLAFDVIPTDWLALEAGVGTNGEGPEFAVMPRLRLPITAQGYLTASTGVSLDTRYVGHESNGAAGFEQVFEGIAEGTTSYAVWSPAYFWNAELGGEREDNRFITRFYLGYARILNASSYTCTEGYFPCSPQKAQSLIYLGFALGYAF